MITFLEIALNKLQRLIFFSTTCMSYTIKVIDHILITKHLQFKKKLFILKRKSVIQPKTFKKAKMSQYYNKTNIRAKIKSKTMATVYRAILQCTTI